MDAHNINWGYQLTGSNDGWPTVITILLMTIIIIPEMASVVSSSFGCTPCSDEIETCSYQCKHCTAHVYVIGIAKSYSVSKS